MALLRAAGMELPRNLRGIFTSVARWKSRSCWGAVKRAYVPILPEGIDPRGRHHCGPHQFHGKTPIQIVQRFKAERSPGGKVDGEDPTTFPWYKVPEGLRDRRFEELWQLAHRCGYSDAMKAVRLLTEDAPAATTAIPVDTLPPRERQRLNRSQLRALRSGNPAVPVHGKGPRTIFDKVD
eukprot:s130_g20.t2